MSKRLRQYTALLCAILVYYVIHEGAHLLYALHLGVFKDIHFMALGMQIDVYAQQMTPQQMGLFCLCGAAATTAAAYGMTLLTATICKSRSKLFRACMYYVTAALLLLDPLYLSVLCGLFGGGDMNGIALLFPESAVRLVCGALLLIHAGVFMGAVLPRYRQSFSQQ